MQNKPGIKIAANLLQLLPLALPLPLKCGKNKFTEYKSAAKLAALLFLI